MEYKLYKLLNIRLLRNNHLFRKCTSISTIIIGIIILIIPLPFSVPIGIIIIVLGTILNIIGNPTKIKCIIKLKKSLLYLMKYPFRKNTLRFKLKDSHKLLKKIFYKKRR